MRRLAPPGRSERAAAGERLAERDLVGVLEVGADRETGGEARDGDVRRLLAQRVGDVERGGLPRGGRVRGEDDLLDRRADAAQELGDLEVLRLDAVDRRKRPAEDVVAPAVLARALDRDDVADLLDDA